MVSSSAPVPAQPPAAARTSAASNMANAAAATGASKLERMRRPSNSKKKNYSAQQSADWDAAFVAPMQATVPAELGGLRLDQALARMFPQYSRNRLQAWLGSGHIRVQGRPSLNQRKQLVAGGERVGGGPPGGAR